MNFSEQFNGYNKQEVDAYIERLKASYESKLMDEKLKTLESERRLLNFKNQHAELANKEKSILEALDVLEKAKKFQEEGTRSFYSLVFDKIKLLVHELDMRFPNMRRNNEYNNIIQELYNLISDYKDKFVPENYITNPINSSNDSMRLLLNKMQEYKKEPAKTPAEVKISPNSVKDTTTYTNFYKRNSFVFKPKEKEENASENNSVTSNANGSASTLNNQTNQSVNNSTNQNYFTQSERKILPDENNIQKYPKSESGFSFEEALHPKEGLEEIMKAFDFYNEGKKNNQSGQN